MKTPKSETEFIHEAQTYVAFPRVCDEQLLSLVEVENLDESHGELDLDWSRGVSDGSRQHARSTVPVQQVRNEAALCRNVHVIFMSETE